MAPFSRSQTGQLILHAIWVMEAKVTLDGGLGARQLVACAVQHLFVAVAEGVDGEAADWLVGTFNCGKEFGISDSLEMKERDTSTDWLTLKGFVAPFSTFLARQFRVN